MTKYDSIVSRLNTMIYCGIEGLNLDRPTDFQDGCSYGLEGKLKGNRSNYIHW